jgi:hypothetical protein
MSKSDVTFNYNIGSKCVCPSFVVLELGAGVISKNFATTLEMLVEGIIGKGSSWESNIHSTTLLKSNES